ncbi:hypothetical protein GCM10010954_29840 [Halobacillus andaensis]|uniref:DUF4825 domain-containing protein n=1 Tax=Halobacillus andaensis TaxID=1176239 RepID=A0A917B6Z8_HALAA|nr:hypothetical protein [Halobacillus andaensis]MBP2005087.1 hypothetical protein [Halobacillus andaensis]GGF28796.1 hypothetical protein GCM10010954_29840 [Halobacillus andaensis]
MRRARLLVIIAVLTLLTACFSNEGDGKEEDTLFLYKGTKISDREFTGTVIRSMPYHKQMTDFSLYPNEHQITIRYSDIQDKELQKMILTVSTYAFSLIEGVNLIVLVTEGERARVYEEELKEWYGNSDYDDASRQEELDNMIDSSIDNNREVFLDNI